ncbi:hypothetical protein GA0070562_4834 [Micromonospora tulbaghiae]|uniref:Uncharacterized protein n=2 Tax=Micromonospora tulbaghiae TaxID=479978 RepID=A0ABY0KPZ6_9ACTN|nr:hypothetical protein GA0070562_4834 [Micromonospora tulbaghiae]
MAAGDAGGHRRARPFAVIRSGYRRGMTDNDRQWRDEDRTPLHELDQAIARSATDGQGDDVTANDAGEEAAFGHGPEAVDRGAGPEAERREMTDADRAYRPSTIGRTGPDSM